MDQRVQERLGEKIQALQKLLDDPSLTPYLSVDPTLHEEEFILDEYSDYQISDVDQKEQIIEELENMILFLKKTHSIHVKNSDQNVCLIDYD